MPARFTGIPHAAFQPGDPFVELSPVELLDALVLGVQASRRWSPRWAG
jgi:hypothetical protein